MNEILTAVKRIVGDEREPGDITALERYLCDGESRPHTHEVLAAYLEYAGVVDWKLVNLFVRYPGDPMISATAILNGSLRRGNSLEFWKAVEEIAVGEEWDAENDARIMAILALSLHPSGCGERIRSILSSCAGDASPVVRDTAVVAAQRCLGVPESDLLSGSGAGDLRYKVEKKISDWLSYR